MSHVPPARVGNPTVRDRLVLAAWWVRRHWRKLLAAALILTIVDCKVTHIFIPAPDHQFDWAKQSDDPSSWRDYAAGTGNLDKARPHLRRHHDSARAALRQRGAPRADGLDPLLAVLLEAVDDRVALRARPLAVDTASFAAPAAVPGAHMVDVASRLAAADTRCDTGFSAAFEAATGGKAIVARDESALELDAVSDARAPAAAIDLTWSARASGAIYAGSDEHAFPGFAVTATVTLTAGDRALARITADVDPGQSFEYSTYQPGALFGADEGDVVAGMVQAVCRRLGEQLIAGMTGLQGAAAPPKKEESKKPEDRCRAGGLINRGACSEAANEVLAAGGETARVEAQLLLDSGCRRNDPDACLRAADLVDGREALLLRLRGCDLGGGTPPICDSARQAGRAAVTLGKRDRIVAVRWGMWFQNTPTSITWVATPANRADIEARLQAELAAGRARVYDRDELPPGIVAPAGATTVYAVHGPDQPLSRDPKRCPECGPDDHIDRFGFRMTCTCLPPSPSTSTSPH